VHKGVEFEKAGAVPDPSTAESEEFEVVLRLLQRSLTDDPQRFLGALRSTFGIKVTDDGSSPIVLKSP